MQSLTVDAVYSRRPEWVRGSISSADARFLYGRVLASDATTIIEVGTGLGTSAAVMAGALAARADTYTVVAYDNKTTYREDRPIGDAAQHMVPPELLDRIDFRNPRYAIDVRDDFPEDSLRFAFIDANHKHPWPALDLLAVLPCLQVGAEVAMHDINMPLIHPEFQIWGAKYLFDGLDLEKHADPTMDPPNIGSVIVPDKATLRRQLLGIVDQHPWESEVPDRITAALL